MSLQDLLVRSAVVHLLALAAKHGKDGLRDLLPCISTLLELVTCNQTSYSGPAELWPAPSAAFLLWRLSATEEGRAAVGAQQDALSTLLGRFFAV